MVASRVLVTGGLGWIGSHLAAKLVREGYQVHIVDQKTHEEAETFPGLLDRVQGCQIFHRDCADKGILGRVSGGEFSQVYHLAAYPRVPWSMKNPLESLNQNLQKTVQLLEACRHAAKSPRFVFASSAAVYGDPGNLYPGGMKVHHRPNPTSPYGLHKWQSEEHCEWYRKTYGVDAVSLRYFNVFGPGQVPEDSYSTVICRWLCAMKSGAILYVYGDGTQERDYVFLDDVVEATFRAGTLGTLPFDEEDPRVLNVGTGERTSTREVLNKVLGLLPAGADTKVYWTNARPGDVPWTEAGDLWRTLGVLGEIPRKTFDEDLQKTWEWWQRQP